MGDFILDVIYCSIISVESSGIYKNKDTFCMETLEGTITLLCYKLSSFENFIKAIEKGKKLNIKLNSKNGEDYIEHIDDYDYIKCDEVAFDPLRTKTKEFYYKDKPNIKFQLENDSDFKQESRTGVTIETTQIKSMGIIADEDSCPLSYPKQDEINRFILTAKSWYYRTLKRSTYNKYFKSFIQIYSPIYRLKAMSLFDKNSEERISKKLTKISKEVFDNYPITDNRTIENYESIEGFITDKFIDNNIPSEIKEQLLNGCTKILKEILNPQNLIDIME